MAHLGHGDKVDSGEQQEQLKLAKPVPEKKKQSKPEPINELYHKQLGYLDLTVTRSTKRVMDISLTGTAEICNDCVVWKA